MDKIKKGIPFNVKIRTYIPHLIIGIIMLILYIILSLFIFKDTSISFTEIMRANAAKEEEIIISNEKNEGEYFYYLKNYFLKTNDDKSLSVDILMVDENHYYNDNDIYFEGKLEKNTCAISKNIAASNNLKIGSEIIIIGTDKKIKISSFLKPEIGIDKEYKRDGIIIISYDNELLDKAYQYITFNTDTEIYLSLVNLYNINDWKKNNINIVIRSIIIFTLVSILSIVLCEIFIFKKRIKDYLIYMQMGKSKNILFGNIIFENLIKYFIPLLLVFLFNINLLMYEIAYIILISILCLTTVIVIFLYSILISLKLR